MGAIEMIGPSGGYRNDWSVGDHFVSIMIIYSAL